MVEVAGSLQRATAVTAAEEEPVGGVVAGSTSVLGAAVEVAVA